MNFSFSLSLIAALALFASCKGGNASSSAPSSDTLSSQEVVMTHARLIKLTEHGGITKASILNPWDTTKIFQSYWLIPDSVSIAGIPSNVCVIRTPMKSSVIFTGVHAALVNELGHGESIKGMVDLNFVSDPSVQERINSGAIINCGTYLNPNPELIMSLDPAAIFVSPYEGNTSNDRLTSLGIPIIECADYMEPIPLGRAEWIKFYGRLYGENHRADSLFNEIEKKYKDLKNATGHIGFRPLVLFDRIYGHAWYVPEKQSTTAQFINDAGGRNPFDYLENNGSVPLSSEEVLMKAENADYWFIRHAGENLSYQSLASDNPVYSRFKAFKEGNVFTCNTTKTAVFDHAAFHPERLLEELVSVLHPELTDSSYRRQFYIKLEK